MSINSYTSTYDSNIVDRQTYSGIKFKKIHVADLSEIYGSGQRGLVADEKINKGELILRNDSETSIFYPFDDPRCSLPLDDFLKLVDEQNDTEVKAYLLRYSLQYDDKHVFVPRNYQTRQTMDLSALLNHSCQANCTSTFTDEVIAIEDIEPNTILTVDYGIGITDDAKLIPFTTCSCGAESCAGDKVFQRYKQAQWQDKFYDLCFPYQNGYKHNSNQYAFNDSIPLTKRLKEARSYQNSTVTVLYEDRLIDPQIPSDCKAEFQMRGGSPIPVLGYLQQLWTLAECYDLVKDYEKRFHVKYQLLVRTRVDIVNRMPLTFDREGALDMNTTMILPRNRYYPQVYDDGFAIGPVELMYHYMMRWYTLKQCPPDGVYQPGIYLFRHLSRLLNVTVDHESTDAADAAIRHGPNNCH